MRRVDRMSTEDVRSRAERIWRASLRLQALIETIMTYTRINAGALTLNPIPFSLKVLIRRVCEEQGSYDPNRLIDLDIKDLPATIVGDPVLLEQALIIVLSNAMKYSPPDRAINIAAHAAGETVTVTVKDQGIGVLEGDLPFLMQPFFRGRNARSMPGTGLGLSLAWNILRLHGGSLRIEGEEGRGTTVTMTLPKEAAPPSGNDLTAG